MSAHKTSKHEIAGIHADAPAETLLIEQFRYWMIGHATRQFGDLNRAWDALLCGTNVNSAKMLFAEIHVFTRILCDHSVRQIECLPGLGRCISRDEGLLLALVQASQINEAFTEIAAASELLGTYEVEALIDASHSLATVLLTTQLMLEPIEAVTRLNCNECGITGRILH